MASSPIYPVNERFLTFQGEGANLGKRAYFIRLQGCDVRCSFCDTASTWHADHVPKDVEQFAAGPLAEEALAALAPVDRLASRVPGELVVLTGGEPSLHNLAPLVDELHSRRLTVAIETAGNHPLPPGLDWVCLSPKPQWRLPLRENVASADEFKIIVRHREDIGAGLAAISHRRDKAPVWLMPEWSRRNDPATLGVIAEAVLSPDNSAGLLRAGVQLHKSYAMIDGGADHPRRHGPLGGVNLAEPGVEPPWLAKLRALQRNDVAMLPHEGRLREVSRPYLRLLDFVDRRGLPALAAAGDYIVDLPTELAAQIVGGPRGFLACAQGLYASPADEPVVVTAWRFPEDAGDPRPVQQVALAPLRSQVLAALQVAHDRTWLTDSLCRRVIADMSERRA